MTALEVLGGNNNFALEVFRVFEKGDSMVDGITIVLVALFEDCIGRTCGGCEGGGGVVSEAPLVEGCGVELLRMLGAMSVESILGLFAKAAATSSLSSNLRFAMASGFVAGNLAENTSISTL